MICFANLKSFMLLSAKLEQQRGSRDPAQFRAHKFDFASNGESRDFRKNFLIAKLEARPARAKNLQNNVQFFCTLFCKIAKNAFWYFFAPHPNQK